MPFDIIKFAERFFKLPEPLLKEQWVGEYEAVSIHVDGTFPKRLIEERRPYEDEAIKKYREENYEAITKGPFSRFNTDLSRVFSGSQVTIKVESDDLQAFIEGPNFDGMDLRSYWSRKLCRRMIVDPNGVLVRWVDKIPEAPNEPVQPVLFMVLSKNILHFTEDVLAWEAEERSPIVVHTKDGDEVQDVGLVYYIVDKEAYWKLVQTGRKEDGNFELRKHYPHLLNRLPLDVLGGEETLYTDQKTNRDHLWYQSFVSNAIPYANECIRQWSDHQGVLVTSAFPLREVEPIDCAYVGCDKGWIRSKGVNDEVTKSKCPSCHGKGKVAPFGPYGVLIRKKSSMLQGGNAADEKDMVKFISPDTAILEFGSKTWRDYKADLERELNLMFVDDAQSGVAKDIDREPKTAKMDAMGHQIYMVLMKNTLRDFAELMDTGISVEGIAITLPPTFVVRSEGDLTSEMKSLKEGAAPFMLDGMVWLEYARKRFPGRNLNVRCMEALADYDVLFGMSDEDVVAQKAGGIVDDLLVRRHTLGMAAIRRLVRMKGEGVLDAPNLFDLIDDMVEEILPAARLVEPTMPEGESGDMESE